MKSSVQGGIEYDTNVFKTFGQEKGDFVLRALLKSRGDIRFNRHWQLGLAGLLGAKKYIHFDEQDRVIVFLESPLIWVPSSSVRFVLIPNFKLNEERDKIEEDPLDVNEDYLSTTTRLLSRIRLPHTFSLEPYVS